MSTDYGEKERQFLETLKADTGRDVAEWMAAIAAEKLTARNDIIDWLRRQGFMFSKASWLERIHNNGGRPLYENGGAPRRLARTRRASIPAAPPPPAPLTPAPIPPAAASTPAAPLPSATVIPLRIVPKAQPVPAPSPPPAPPKPAAPTQDLETLLMKAKAFRPLASYILSEITKAVPGVAPTAAATYVLLSKGSQTFGVLTISAKELRLGLALKGAPIEAPYQAAKLPSLPADVAAPLSHMAVLNDARQINEALIARVRDAADRVG